MWRLSSKEIKIDGFSDDRMLRKKDSSIKIRGFMKDRKIAFVSDHKPAIISF